MNDPYEQVRKLMNSLATEQEGYECKAGDMLFYIEDTWIGNRPIFGFKDNKIYAGWGFPVPLFSLDDYGSKCSIHREQMEAILNGKGVK